MCLITWTWAEPETRSWRNTFDWWRHLRSTATMRNNCTLALWQTGIIAGRVRNRVSVSVCAVPLLPFSCPAERVTAPFCSRPHRFADVSIVAAALKQQHTWTRRRCFWRRATCSGVWDTSPCLTVYFRTINSLEIRVVTQRWHKGCFVMAAGPNYVVSLV